MPPPLNMCAVCNKPIAGAYCNIGKKFYHGHWFLCQNCKGDLSQGYYEHQSQLVCEPSYQDRALSKCRTCQIPVISGKAMVALGRNYHKACLICVDYRKVIGRHEIYPVSGKIYCINCHFGHKLAADEENKAATEGKQ